MRPILPAWSEPDAALHARLGEAIDPDRKVLAALERVVPLSGKRIADVGPGIGSESHHPNVRIVEGEATALPLRDRAVDVVLTSLIDPDDGSLPAVREALRVIRPGGRLVAIGHYGRDDVSALLEPEVVERVLESTQRRTGWWLRNGFKIKVVHARLDLGDATTAHELLPRLYGDRGRAYLMGAHRSSLRLYLVIFHRGREES